MTDKLSPEHLANAIRNYAEFSDAELERCAKAGNSIAVEVLSTRKEPMPKIVAVDQSGDYKYKTGSLPSSLTAKDIENRLGFKANCKDDESKVKHSWDFTVNGMRCGIWDYKGCRWSIYDPHNVLSLVFPEIG